MNSRRILPDNYIPKVVFDMRKLKGVRTSATVSMVNAVGFAAALIVGLAAWFVVPMDIFNVKDVRDFIREVVLLVGLLVFMAAHEILRRVLMKRCGAGKISSGFDGRYIYSGCEEYFSKKEYSIIVGVSDKLFLVVLLILNIVLPIYWFWVIHALHMVNVYFAVRDEYLFWKLHSLPENTLVQDLGLVKRMYCEADEEELAAYRATLEDKEDTDEE